jgi:hypothetical protein
MENAEEKLTWFREEDFRTCRIEWTVFKTGSEFKIRAEHER